MYTIGLFNFKIYVCNSRRLMPIIQRNAKTISFAPIHNYVTKTYSDIDHPNYDRDADELNHEMSSLSRAALSPGPSLDAQNLRMAADVMEQLDDLAAEVGDKGPKDVKLLTWIRHLIVQASAAGVWGEQHPFLDPTVEQGFWDWQDNLGTILVGLARFARKGSAGRQRVFDAMYKYGKKGFPDDCSQLLRDRYDCLDRYGIPFEEKMRILSSFAVAVFPNTAPTMYWSIYETISRPDVLAALRRELEENAVTRRPAQSSSTDPEADGQTYYVLDVAALKQSCPLALSIIQETQRTRHIHASLRIVLEDTILDGRYLVKKGNHLQMPGAPIHHSTEFYGPDAAEFNPYRFVPTKEGRKDLPGSAFLAWGAPPHLCPARQFAMTEMLIILAMVVLRFEIVRADGRGFEKGPKLRLGEIVSIPEPKKDLKIRFKLRDGFGAAKWQADVGESRSRVPIASG